MPGCSNELRLLLLRLCLLHGLKGIWLITIILNTISTNIINTLVVVVVVGVVDD